MALIVRPHNEAVIQHRATTPRDAQRDYAAWRTVTADDPAVTDMSKPALPDALAAQTIELLGSGEIEIRFFSTAAENATFTLACLGYRRGPAAGWLLWELTVTVGATTYAYHPVTGVADGATWREAKAISVTSDRYTVRPLTGDGVVGLAFDPRGCSHLLCHVTDVPPDATVLIAGVEAI